MARFEPKSILDGQAPANAQRPPRDLRAHRLRRAARTRARCAARARSRDATTTRSRCGTRPAPDQRRDNAMLNWTAARPTVEGRFLVKRRTAEPERVRVVHGI